MVLFLLVNTGGGADQRLFEGGYGQWDARVSYEMELANGATLGLSAYGRNLSDEEWREQALFLGGFRTGFQGWEHREPVSLKSNTQCNLTVVKLSKGLQMQPLFLTGENHE